MKTFLCVTFIFCFLTEKYNCSRFAVGFNKTFQFLTNQITKLSTTKMDII